MKLLSVNLARAIWLGSLSDFNPKGISLYPVLFPFMVERYKFRQSPPVTEIADLSKGISFQGGEFNIGEEYPIVVNVTLYNDGFVADTTSNTKYSDAFLKDMYETFSEVFKMPNYNSIIKKRLYLSQVFVSTDKSLESLNTKLTVISQYLSKRVERGDKVFQLGGISFWPDQTDKLNPSPFMVERALNTPFSENRYYSTAPLQTAQHLELLDKLESILS